MPNFKQTFKACEMRRIALLMISSLRAKLIFHLCHLGKQAWCSSKSLRFQYIWVGRVRFPDTASWMAWVCRWFSSLLRVAFLWVLSRQKSKVLNSNSIPTLKATGLLEERLLSASVVKQSRFSRVYLLLLFCLPQFSFFCYLLYFSHFLEKQVLKFKENDWMVPSKVLWHLFT